jgi:hypothetical protein
MKVRDFGTATNHEHLIATSSLLLVNLAAGFEEVPDLAHLQTMSSNQLERLVHQLTEAVELVLEHTYPLPLIERSTCDRR